MDRPRVVMVVEDDDNLRSQLTGYVADQLALPVVGARNAAEAIERADTARPNVVLVDLTMPAGDGFELVRRLRRSAAGRGAWIVGVTSWIDPRSAFDAGCDEVLVRPFDLALVRRAVESSRARKDLVYCLVPASPRLLVGDLCPRCGRRVDDPADHMRQAGRCQGGGSGRGREEASSGRRVTGRG